MNAMQLFANNYLDKEKELRILDIGSLRYTDGDSTYRNIFLFSKWKYFGLDIVSGENVDIVSSDPYRYPFKDDYFDVIISGQAAEHVARPWEWIKEIFRILKGGGLVCIIAPGGGKRHTEKDYWRILADGMQSLLECGGFIVIDVTRSKKGKWKDCVGIGKKSPHYKLLESKQ